MMICNKTTWKYHPSTFLAHRVKCKHCPLGILHIKKADVTISTHYLQPELILQACHYNNITLSGFTFITGNTQRFK